MKLPYLAAAAAAVLSLGAAAAGEQKATFIDGQGKEIGTAVLQETPDGVLIRVEVAGLPPGEHGFHIHEKGQCDPQGGFKSAGGHFAPAKHPHGYYGKSGHHAGDMPNQFVSREGRLQADLYNPEVHLTGKSLLDKDGSALMVHAKADDYGSQPSGAAGDRIACAVIAPAR